MSVGQGSVKFTGLTLPSVPPFPAGAADTGLSVDPVTGNIVLGNPLAEPYPGSAFIGAGRTINMEQNAAIELHGFDGLGASAGSLFMQGNALQLVNPLGSVNPGLFMGIQDANNIAFQLAIASDVINGITTLGGGNTIATSLIFDDSGHLRITNNYPPTVPVDNGAVLQVDGDITAADSLGLMLSTDRATGLYQLGDIDNGANGLRLTIDDASQVGRIGNNIADQLLIDIANNFYSFSDINAALNGTQLTIDDANNAFRARDFFGDGLFIDFSALRYRLGDIDTAGNGNVIIVDDATNVFDINNTAGNIGININGVAGFTGTVTPVVSITVNNGIVTAVA